MTIQAFMTRKFMDAVVATPAGRAFLLNEIADAEDNGEAQIFDQIIGAIDDPQLQKIVARHRADEIRHGELFRAARDRTGVDPGPVPEEAKVLDHINRAVGGFFDRPIRTEAEVVEAYLILQVIEERAVNQFVYLEAAFKKVDPETARIFAEVGKDEERHLKYCRAVAQRYGKDPEAIERRLTELRDIEAEAFRSTSSANMLHVVARGYIRGTASRMFWLCVDGLANTLAVKPLTQFATAPSAA